MLWPWKEAGGSLWSSLLSMSFSGTMNLLHTNGDLPVYCPADDLLYCISSLLYLEPDDGPVVSEP